MHSETFAVAQGELPETLFPETLLLENTCSQKHLLSEDMPSNGAFSKNDAPRKTFRRGEEIERTWRVLVLPLLKRVEANWR